MRWTSRIRIAALAASLVVAGLASIGADPAWGGTSGDAGSLSGGDNFTCAVTSAATVKCWGTNTHGQLGDGTTDAQWEPQTVPGLVGVAEVSAGWQHACARTVDGAVSCWGLNGNGQIGDGTTATPRRTPTPVVGLTSGVRAISAGLFHTCALTDEGAVKCWGANAAGALGDGTTIDRASPVDVTGLGSGVQAIAAGGGITCAIDAAGALLCWGDNQNGGVGDGTTINRSTPTGVTGMDAGVASISAASTHPYGSRACAVTDAGAARCWGVNNQGQLGDGTLANRLTPVDVTGLQSGVAALTTGSSHTCARLTNGAARCWGQWAVGDGSGELRTTPVAVVGLGSEVVELQAGGFHACAQRSTGAVLCWGGNNAGQLGLGHDDPAVGRIPRDVSGSFHRPECPTLRPEPHTSFTASDGYGVGSTLSFSADPGFALETDTPLTCRADLTFDGPAPTARATSEIALSPPGPVTGGTEIEIQLSGFAPDTEVGWCQGVDDAPGGAGNCSSISLGQTDELGNLTTSLRIDRFIYASGPDRWADCAVEPCVIGAAAVDDLDATAVTTPLVIDVPPPPVQRGTISLDPPRQEESGDVTVTGTGFRPGATVDIHQCTRDPATPASCTRPLRTVEADAAGAFFTGVRAEELFAPPGGTTTRCLAPSGACVIAAAEAADFPGTVTAAPMVDPGPLARVVPGGGQVVENDDGEALVIPVSLAGDWHERIEVRWSTIVEPEWDPALRADPGVDYVATSGTVIFEPLQTTAAITIPIVDDQITETPELVVVSFQRPDNARMGGFYGLGFGFIVDDDAP